MIDASSSFGSGWEAENAVDGDLTTEWATGGNVGAIEVQPRGAAS